MTVFLGLWGLRFFSKNKLFLSNDGFFYIAFPHPGHFFKKMEFFLIIYGVWWAFLGIGGTIP
jgi:hypothetical protein